MRVKLKVVVEAVVFDKVELGAALEFEECQNILVGKSKQAEWI